MQTMQSDGRVGIESPMRLPHQPAASTSTSTSYSVSSNVPYLPEQSGASQFNCDYCEPYPTSSKKRVLRLKRIYSTRTRGRSSPILSLARKLGRFRVRTVIVQETASDDANKINRWISMTSFISCTQMCMHRIVICNNTWNELFYLV